MRISEIANAEEQVGLLKIIMDTSKPNLCESNQHQHHSEILEIENLLLIFFHFE
jgi:hypothetical protein